MTISTKRIASLLVVSLLHPGLAAADPVVVRNVEGLVHGFLSLRNADGTVLADGELLQTSPRGDRVTSRLVLRFKDGSVQDETVVFTQKKVFRLLTDHVVQKGPAFPWDMDARLDAVSGQVTVRWREKGKDKDEQHSERLKKLPADLANGLVFVVLKNVPDAVLEITGHMVAFTPKPRLVKLVMSAAGEETYAMGEVSGRAVRYRVKPELGGVLGVVAPIVGKDPPPVFVSIAKGEVPAFLRFEGSMFPEGPTWRIDLSNPRLSGERAQ